MAVYIVRRFMYGVLVLFLLSMLLFMIMRMVPGDVVALQLADSNGVSEEQIAQLKEQLGLHQPVWAQYGQWLAGVFQGNLGHSFWSDEPVVTLVADRLPVTLELALLSIVIAIAVGIPAGVISAIKKDSWIDNSIRVVAVLGLSIPNFWMGLLIILSLVLMFNWVPPLGYKSFFENPWVNLQQMIFPALVLGSHFSASIIRMTRSATLEVLHSDYIRTVRAKGAQERVVIYKHALRNSFVSILTLIGIQIGFLLGGTVIIESIFSLPGLGSLIFEKITMRDYPVIQTAVLVYGMMFVFSNLIVDIAYGWIDPRIRYG